MMERRPKWIADIHSHEVNALTMVQILNARKPGFYMLGNSRLSDNPAVVSIYFQDNTATEEKSTQSCVVGYVDI